MEYKKGQIAVASEGRASDTSHRRGTVWCNRPTATGTERLVRVQSSLIGTGLDGGE
jgi:hypothetical protein